MAPPFTENETLEGAIKERCQGGANFGGGGGGVSPPSPGGANLDVSSREQLQVPREFLTCAAPSTTYTKESKLHRLII